MSSINDQILNSKLNDLNCLPCNDFLAFQDLLSKSRKIDDNITNLLNTTIPTDSFLCEKNKPEEQCKKLWEQLLKTYEQRELAIKKCLLQKSNYVLELKKKKDLNDNLGNNKILKQEQSRLRLLRNELSVEEVVKDRSSKLFKEKCRNFYQPQ